MVLQVAVIGPAEASDELRELGYSVGKALAHRGATVVCGGGRGVMAAAAAGARSAGGVSVGVLPGDDPACGNQYLTVVVATGMGEARNAVVVRSGAAVIAIGGSWGTLSELALARKMGKRVVNLRGWRLAGADGRPVDDELLQADTAEQAVELALGPPTT